MHNIQKICNIYVYYAFYVKVKIILYMNLLFNYTIMYNVNLPNVYSTKVIMFTIIFSYTQ